MSLTVGIVGLPNVGKSTLFNALLERQIATVANYPFTTIKPHTGVVGVTDENLQQLFNMLKPKIKTPATVTFVDIAGLVKNAHKGQGLGNEFLGHIRNVDIIVHVIRSFDDAHVSHVMGSVDPDRDRDIINQELSLAGIDKPTIEWINSSLHDFENVDTLITKSYNMLDLITFYTIKKGAEVRATALKNGSLALDAAEKIHTDFAKKFIKAEVVSVGTLLKIGSWKSAKQHGKVRLEGRDYVVHDGDVIEFKVGT